MQSCKKDDPCPDIEPLPEDEALALAEAARASARNGNEGGANQYINTETGETHIVSGNEAGVGKPDGFEHDIGSRGENETVGAISHTHINIARGGRGTSVSRIRRGQNGPSEQDQAAMNQIGKPVITVGPDVNSQLYRRDGQDLLQVLPGSNPNGLPHLGRQEIIVCEGNTQC